MMMMMMMMMMMVNKDDCLYSYCMNPDGSVLLLSRRNTFVGGKCAPPSALLVSLSCIRIVMGFVPAIEFHQRHVTVSLY